MGTLVKNVVQSLMEFASRMDQRENQEHGSVDPWTQQLFHHISPAATRESIEKMKSELGQIKERKMNKEKNLRRLEDDFKVWLLSNGIS